MYLVALLLSVPLPYISNEAGWIGAEWEGSHGLYIKFSKLQMLPL
jgi:hypothetical protein